MRLQGNGGRGRWGAEGGRGVDGGGQGAGEDGEPHFNCEERLLIILILPFYNTT